MFGISLGGVGVVESRGSLGGVGVVESGFGQSW